jgi:hypothetical protein
MGSRRAKAPSAGKLPTADATREIGKAQSTESGSSEAAIMTITALVQVNVKSQMRDAIFRLLGFI